MITRNAPETKFAPAERADTEQLQNQHNILTEIPWLTYAFDAMPQIVMILNEYRQTVYANKATLEAFKIDDINDISGKRPGEALSCIHSQKSPGGCGTSEYCKNCGAVLSVLSALNGTQESKSCCIVKNPDNLAVNLAVKATPLEIEGKKYAVVSATDISEETMKGMMERIFFHDILNLAGAAEGLSQILLESIDENNQKLKEISKTIHQSTKTLKEEITAQKDLAAAERGTLNPNIEQINSLNFLKEITDIYSHHEACRDKNISVFPNSADITFVCDRVILGRIIGNLIKNAIEASEEGMTVRAGCETTGENKIVFRVHNQTFIDDETQHKIFERSFSTKGTDRGLGTYSVKLLTENGLNGKVRFTSEEESGTSFYITLPVNQ